MTPSSHDFSLNSGERQVAHSLAGIRGDHKNRYSFGLSHLTRPGFGMDLFCGNGYGAFMIAQAGHTVLGIDASNPAIAMAQDCYQDPNIIFAHKEWPFHLPPKAFDFIFCLESVEHVQDGQGFVTQMARALKPWGWLILTTPNETRMPFNPKQHKFHTRHYTKAETFALVETAGLTIKGWGGQTVYTITEDGTHQLLYPNSAVVSQAEGQFTIVCCQNRRRT